MSSSYRENRYQYYIILNIKKRTFMLIAVLKKETRNIKFDVERPVNFRGTKPTNKIRNVLWPLGHVTVSDQSLVSFSRK